MISAVRALELLQKGNRRFVSGRRLSGYHKDPDHRLALVGGQEPFAVVLGCSDSRVPAEIVFDQGLGDLFVIRVAGNIIAPSLVGSVEFAAEQLGTQLVVVLGHSDCGAVQATLESLERSTAELSPNLGSIVECIRPVVENLPAMQGDLGTEDPLTRAVRANVHNSVEQLSLESSTLRRRIDEGRLMIVGAEYALETGRVRFFDSG